MYLNKIILKLKFNETFISLLRFPVTLLFSFMATFLSIYLDSFNQINSDNFHIFNGIMSCALGIPLSLSFYLFFERLKFKGKKIIAGISSLSVILTYYYFSSFDHSLNYIYKYIQIFILLHLVLSFSPFILKKELNGFWQFNRILLQRISLSIFYSAIIFIFIMIAIQTCIYLFEFNVKSILYYNIFFFCLFIIQTWFFVLGIPKNINSLNTLELYPSFLKFFSQNILVPIILSYFIILYIYMFKILFLWDLPKGLIGWLVSILGILGILTKLLINKDFNKYSTKWAVFFSKYFHFLMFPLLGMLFIGLYLRIADYGITENRYILLVLALWLLLISLFYVISKSKNLKIIPISLSFVFLISLIGPWSIYSLSFKSQFNIAKSFLIQNKILVDNQIHKSPISLTLVQRQLISNKIYYLIENHGLDSVKEIFGEKAINAIKVDKYKYPDSNFFAKILLDGIGINYLDQWDKEQLSDEFFFHLNLRSIPLDIQNYDTLLKFNFYENENKITIENFKLEMHQEKSELSIYKDQKLIIAIPLQSFLNNLNSVRVKDDAKENQFYNIKDMTLHFESKNMEVKLIFEHLSIIKMNGIFKLSAYSEGTILIKEKIK